MKHLVCQNSFIDSKFNFKMFFAYIIWFVNFLSP